MDFQVRPFRAGEERYVAEAHGRVYREEYRWGDSFVRYAEQIPLAFAARARFADEELWVAEAEGKLVGSIMLCRAEEARVGQLRLFLVEKDYRCLGVGAALLETLLRRARQAGYERLLLLTASPLTEAIQKYQRLGFRETGRTENRDWSLDGEILWELAMELPLTSETTT